MQVWWRPWCGHDSKAAVGWPHGLSKQKCKGARKPPLPKRDGQVTINATQHGARTRCSRGGHCLPPLNPPAGVGVVSHSLQQQTAHRDSVRPVS